MANAFPVDAARRCIVFARPRLSRAGQHAHQVQAHFFRNLTLGHVQLDELHTLIKKRPSHLTELEAQVGEVGVQWVWTAMDPVPKLLWVAQVGPRTRDRACRAVH